MGIEKPLISIIVPVYNVEKYLPQCLDSLLAQSLKEIEIICINDCSPDNCALILNHYAQKDARIKVINLPENRRQGGARNEGIKAAQADYIGFVDSDDWVSPLMYEKLYNAAKQYDADIVSPRWYISAYEENQHYEKTLNGIPLDSLSQSERDKALIMNGFRFWTNIFKKDIFIKNDLFFPEKKLFEDNAIVTALHLSAKNIVQIDDCPYFYRCCNVSSSRSLDNPHFFDRMETSILYLEHMKRLGFYQLYKDEIEYAFISLYYRTTLIGCFTRFSIPDRTHMYEIMDYMHTNMPNYRKNRYYKRIQLKHRVLLYLCEINIPLAIIAYKAVKIIRKNGMAQFK